jgi:glycosyltransferase involved in cell wall biosynthesis
VDGPPVKRQNIICFGKDWNEDPTSNHHVMQELAKSHRVLWLNSVGTRTPKLSSKRDLGKIVRKVRQFSQGPINVENDLWIYTPLVLPFPHSPAAQRLNRQILRATLRALRLRLGMKEFQLWSFLPNVGEYAGTLGESLVVYYCTDEWSMFSYIDEGRMAAAEEKLLRRTDVIFAVNDALVESKRSHNPQTFLAPHGVDHALFATALDPALPLPADVAGLKRPILGFYGTIQDWVDLDLIAYLAERHPEWSIVLLGGVHVDTAAVTRFPNVHLLGRKAKAELPAYCKAFDVALIPYVISERMKYVNPIKLREYLCAGCPVVSTAVPEVERYPEWAWVAGDKAEFERGVVAALAADSPARRRASSEAMRSETWEARVAQIAERVAEAQARKVVSHG